MSLQRIRKLALITALLAALSITTRCAEIDLGISFKVICEGNFTGYYIIDGGSLRGFDTIITQGGFQVFEKDIDNMETLEITAERTADTDLLQIKIYRDDEKVKEIQLDSGDIGIFFLNLEYEYGEEESS